MFVVGDRRVPAFALEGGEIDGERTAERARTASAAPRDDVIGYRLAVD